MEKKEINAMIHCRVAINNYFPLWKIYENLKNFSSYKFFLYFYEKFIKKLQFHMCVMCESQLLSIREISIAA